MSQSTSNANARPRSIWIVAVFAALGAAWLFAKHAAPEQSDETKLARDSAATTSAWAPLHGKHYFVSNHGSDEDDGSASRPWATLQHAAVKAQAGSTIHVLPGIYQGPIVTRQSGQAEARIRFLSEQQWQARVIVAGKDIVWRNDGSYIDIAGFDVSGGGAYGILNMGSNVRIIGNHVHDIPAPGCTSDGGAGILNGNYSAHDNDIISNVVNRIGVSGERCYRVHGIYHSNLRGHIWNNVSCDNQSWGIHLWHAPRSVVISNNLVCRNGEGGIVIGSGDKPGAAPADHMLVANNILIGNGRPRAAYAIQEYGSVGDDNHYVNNLIFGSDQKIVLKRGHRDIGTIRQDPKLVNYQSDDSADYHLAAGSPAIGSGTTAGAPPFDLEGKLRPVAGRWDIGPYEYKSRGDPWPWY